MIYEDTDLHDYAIRHGYAAVEADVWADHATIYLELEKQATIEGNDIAFDYDYPQHIIRVINIALANHNIRAYCWRFRWMGGQVVKWISIENESARLHAESVLWDDDNHQLVAALFAANDSQVSKAVMAGLMSNSEKVGKTWLHVDYRTRVYLASAKGRYVRVSRSLSSDSNAAGSALAVLHPKAGNPREFVGDFYVVATQDEDLRQKFRQRLDMAIQSPVKAEWANYLFCAGMEAGLVKNLSQFGTAFFGVRVLRSDGEDRWVSIISDGLRNGEIKI